MADGLRSRLRWTSYLFSINDKSSHDLYTFCSSTQKQLCLFFSFLSRISSIFFIYHPINLCVLMLMPCVRKITDFSDQVIPFFSPSILFKTLHNFLKAWKTYRHRNIKIEKRNKSLFTSIPLPADTFGSGSLCL